MTDVSAYADDKGSGTIDHMVYVNSDAESEHKGEGEIENVP